MKFLQNTSWWLLLAFLNKRLVRQEKYIFPKRSILGIQNHLSNLSLTEEIRLYWFSRSELLCEKSVKNSQNSEENTCARVSFLTCSFIKKEALTKVFSCEFCDIFKNTLFTEHFWVTASGYLTRFWFHFWSVQSSKSQSLQVFPCSFHVLWGFEITDDKYKFLKYNSTTYRSSRPEVFCKKRFNYKFRNFHQKTFVPEPLFKKVAGARPATVFKKGPWLLRKF